MTPKNTFERGLALVAQQNGDMNMGDRAAIDAALTVLSLDLYFNLMPKHFKFMGLVPSATNEATRAQILSLQAEIGACSGVAPVSSPSGLGLLQSSRSKCSRHANNF